MVLPMGALGDKIGFKRLLLLGSAILASFAVRRAVADGHDADCLTRFAGGGGGDDRPATLAGDPQHLCRGQSAQYGAGAVGSGRPAARLRPAGGRYPAGAFLLGSVFLINVPIVLVVIAINAEVAVPRQPWRREQPLNLLQGRSF